MYSMVVARFGCLPIPGLTDQAISPRRYGPGAPERGLRLTDDEGKSSRCHNDPIVLFDLRNAPQEQHHLADQSVFLGSMKHLDALMQPETIASIGFAMRDKKVAEGRFPGNRNGVLRAGSVSARAVF